MASSASRDANVIIQQRKPPREIYHAILKKATGQVKPGPLVLPDFHRLVAVLEMVGNLMLYGWKPSEILVMGLFLAALGAVYTAMVALVLQHGGTWL